MSLESLWVIVAATSDQQLWQVRSQTYTHTSASALYSLSSLKSAFKVRTNLLSGILLIPRGCSTIPSAIASGSRALRSIWVGAICRTIVLVSSRLSIRIASSVGTPSVLRSCACRLLSSLLQLLKQQLLQLQVCPSSSCICTVSCLSTVLCPTSLHLRPSILRLRILRAIPTVPLLRSPPPLIHPR